MVHQRNYPIVLSQILGTKKIKNGILACSGYSNVIYFRLRPSLEPKVMEPKVMMRQ